MSKARLLRPDREQSEMVVRHLETLIDPDHPARVIWAFVQGCDLAELLDKVRAVQSHPGRPAIDPRLLFALWLYAYTRGIGSARHMETLCETSADFQWLCGGVHVCHRTLSGFRSSNGQIFENLLTQCVAALLAKELVSLDLVTLDGVRVRANAGAGSFGKDQTLERKLVEATALVADLARDIDDSLSQSELKQKKRHSRAAAQRQQRLEQALEQLKAQPSSDTLAGSSDPEPQAPPRSGRASSTDPQARVMKMADGGYRPAYNVQVACDQATALVLAIEPSQLGNDSPALPAMARSLRSKYGPSSVGAIVVDGGYTQGYEAVGQTLELAVEVYGPPRTRASRAASPSARSRLRRKPQQITEWEHRMSQEQSLAARRKRGQAAEYCNARLRAMDGYQLSLRGLRKTKSEMLLRALAHNVQVMNRTWGTKSFARPC